MGEGLKRAFAAARSTQLSAEDLKFLRRLLSHDGVCNRDQLPPADRPQDRARQRCKRLGFARYKGGYWRLTDDGRHALAMAVSS